ncbi:MAG: RHS repeat-associated core domain-containing protein [Chitinophagaceae bacterium]
MEIKWYKVWVKICVLVQLLLCISAFKAVAQKEPYLSELKGDQVAANNSFVVADEKFGNMLAWDKIQQHISVDNIISFELNFDSTIYFYDQPFDCSVELKIYLYGNIADTTEITDSTTYSNIQLRVNFDTLTGGSYKGVALYKFNGAHKFRVKILSISSPQLDPIPPLFRLKGEVLVHRQYKFEDNSSDITRYLVQNDNQLKLEWTPSNYPGAESFDLEYTHVDASSSTAASILGFESSGTFTVPADSLDKWFANNNTRVNTAQSHHLLNLPYDSGFILFRIRGVQVHYPDGVRWEGNWNYLAKPAGTSCSSCPSGVVVFNPGETTLNWQYNASFAEDGKRKEIVSYFDGTLRNRQTVTINNSDNKNIIQETIYDALGRPALSILPVPVKDSTFHYFRGLNKNASGIPYSFSDLLYEGCVTSAGALNSASGAGRYYSGSNEFLSSHLSAGYIPDASGFPFSVTEFMADNTGRIKAQGGVGQTFQLNGGHDTRYFYGKPTQTELDRLFGSEAGDASHYLKNMVVDANGQISVSYLNASGKTIATALAGAPPVHLKALSSSEGASVQMSDELITPAQFLVSGTSYSLSANATFLAPVTGEYVLNYRVDPLKLEKLYGPEKDSAICATCYYDLVVTVKDDCNNVIREEVRPAGNIFDTACNSSQVISDTIAVQITTIGEYYVGYRLVVSKDALNFYDSVHLAENSDIRTLNSFLLDQLKETDFSGCFADCETCIDALGTKEEFSDRFRLIYQTESLNFRTDDSLYVTALYDSLYSICAAKQSGCGSNACDEKLLLLKNDVMPGGQYALFDSVFQLIEVPVNVLAKRTMIAYFTDEDGNRDSVTVLNALGQDSVKIDVKDLSDSMFIANWRDVWADSLVRLHPEYCHYLWCISNSESFRFDRDIENWLDGDSAIAKGWFHPTAYDTIITVDPFFAPGGNGYAFRQKMRDELKYFSRTMAGLGLPDKNILSVIDVILYCKDQPDGWGQCIPDSACRARNREWFMYNQLYLNLKRKYYELARRESANPVFSACVNCYIGKDLLELTGVVLPDSSAYQPFSDQSNCNYACPGGVYSPRDKPGISVFIQYGSPTVAPPAVPEGYGNCSFYNSFDLLLPGDGSCRFFNVWVCVYDSSCGGVCETEVAPPSSCPLVPGAELYANKSRRYPEYVNGDGFIKSIQSANPRQNSEAADVAVLAECVSSCEAKADLWIRQLSRCSSDSVKLLELKQALVEICAAGCSPERPFGASAVPDSIDLTYHSFEEAMLGILGAGTINDSCAVELLADAYSYNRQPVYAERLIIETEYGICTKIAAFRNEWQASATSFSFHQYLTNTIGKAYKLDSLELDDLLNSCSNCNGILKNDVVLPVFFEPGGSPCLSCDSILSAVTAFETKFPGISDTALGYTELFTNFMNQRFGFSLGYSEYVAYLDSCEANALYGVKLCNVPAAEEVSVENDGNTCVVALFATALTNAANEFRYYIDSVRADFREAYMTRCLNASASLTLSAELFEYHYTLYYYDQSGNLVKTIPPAGVQLASPEQLELVKLHRLLQNEACYRYADSIRFTGSGQISWPSSTAFENSSSSIEWWMNLDALGDQTIVSRLAEATYDTSGGTSPFYRHAGVIAGIKDGKIYADFYGIGSDTTQRSLRASSVKNISSLVTPGKWAHLVVLRTGNPFAPLQVWLNGNQVAMQLTANDLYFASVLSGSAPLVIGGENAAHFPDGNALTGTIRNLRIYQRQLPVTEIRQNAFNSCQTPASSAALVFWAPLNSGLNNTVPELITKQSGTLTGFSWAPFLGFFPDHALPTVYEYNSLNQVIKQYTPDADTSAFWYDRLGRLIISQNQEQKDTASYSGNANRFSYTLYDAQGRIKEVGEKSNAAQFLTLNLLDSNAVKNWLNTGINRQVTKTLYDHPVNLQLQELSSSRKRVVASIYLENSGDAVGDSTLYSYDISGNVKTLVQHIKALVEADPSNGKKRIDYDYDLVSGKVNMVRYQEGKGDQFLHRYAYDAENRLTAVSTSRDGLLWNEDATYSYYLHGPLARTELGRFKVQGTDYAYTLQGWLKGINGDVIDPEKEMGEDGKTGSVFSRVSRDVLSFKLGYFTGDYASIGGTAAAAFNQRPYTAPGTTGETGRELFNGNISFVTLGLSKINEGATTGYTYGYDQLNRLVEMRAHTASGAWSNAGILSAYRESIAYDANGNILQYLRKGAGASGLPLDMDSLHYKYNFNTAGRLLNNKLDHVRDQVSNTAYTIDIDDQEAGNYRYDKIGNLTADQAEGLNLVRWTVYGKINRIEKSDGSFIHYGYDPSGNRTLKAYSKNDTLIKTYYVRDAQGNVMGIYEKVQDAPMRWAEQAIYGSSRLGIWKWNNTVPAQPPVVRNDVPIYDSLLFGTTTYELSNHLGNVLATISDKKIGHNDGNGAVDYYLAEVLSQNDYYPFGMGMPGRGWSMGGYRYGFNGKENDNEVKGTGNQQDYGMRIYDPRIGKFLSVDPLSREYAMYSPYQFAGNRPIVAIDLEGLEPQEHPYMLKAIGKSYIGTTNEGNVFEAYQVDSKSYGKAWVAKVQEKVPPVNGMEMKPIDHFMYFDNEAQSWQPWQRGDAPSIRYSQISSLANGTSAFFAAAIIAPFTVAASPKIFTAIMNASPEIFTASLGTRGTSVGVDYFSQVGANFLTGNSNPFTDINATSLLMSGLNPGGNWGTLILNNTLSSSFQYSISDGYKGVLGGGKSVERVGVETLIGAVAGRVGGALSSNASKRFSQTADFQKYLTELGVPHSFKLNLQANQRMKDLKGSINRANTAAGAAGGVISNSSEESDK